MDERGRIFIWVRTLPSLLVPFLPQELISSRHNRLISREARYEHIRHLSLLFWSIAKQSEIMFFRKPLEKEQTQEKPSK